jgi:hypothetical protein
MTLGQRVFIVLTVEPQGQAFTARLQAPSSFDLPADGSRLRYSHIQLPIPVTPFRTERNTSASLLSRAAAP